MLAGRPSPSPPAGSREQPGALQKVLASHRVTLQGGFVLVYDEDRRVKPVSERRRRVVPRASSIGSGKDRCTEASISSSAARASPGKHPLSLRSVTISPSSVFRGRTMHSARQIQAPESCNCRPSHATGIQPDHRSNPWAPPNTWNLFRSRRSIRNTFFLMLLLITVVVFFSSVWLALFLLPSRSRAPSRRWPMPWTRSRRKV